MPGCSCVLLRACRPHHQSDSLQVRPAWWLLRAACAILAHLETFRPHLQTAALLNPAAASAPLPPAGRLHRWSLPLLLPGPLPGCPAALHLAGHCCPPPVPPAAVPCCHALHQPLRPSQRLRQPAQLHRPLRPPQRLRRPAQLHQAVQRCCCQPPALASPHQHQLLQRCQRAWAAGRPGPRQRHPSVPPPGWTVAGLQGSTCCFSSMQHARPAGTMAASSPFVHLQGSVTGSAPVPHARPADGRRTVPASEQHVRTAGIKATQHCQCQGRAENLTCWVGEHQSLRCSRTTATRCGVCQHRQHGLQGCVTVSASRQHVRSVLPVAGLQAAGSPSAISHASVTVGQRREAISASNRSKE